MKKMNKKAFTLIELIVVVAVVGILVLLGMPRFIGHKDKAELARIQHDVKVMEQEIGTVLINNDDDFNNWENNSKDFNQLIQESRLFEKEGIAEKVEPIAEPYKVIPEKYKDKINTKLKGTFYANNDGKVYYEHEKPLLGIPIKPEEKEPGYSDEEIQDLRDKGYIPIATADELNNVRLNEELTYGKGTKWEGEYTGGLDKKYIQVANLDLSGYSEEGWNPIGNMSAQFTGTYDGGNYVITGLKVEGEGKNYQGLFGIAVGTTISNVGLIDNTVTGNNGVGGLVGLAPSEVTIENSYATGSVTGVNSVGGLVGSITNSANISNSYATGSVKGTEDGAGGLVGFANDVIISNSYYTGSVAGGSYNVGGLVGSISQSTIESSYATGSVKGTEVDSFSNKVGGLVGTANRSTIENSYATGSVTVIGSEDYAGGLAGEAYDSTITNSYATGLVTGTGDYIGGLMGRANYRTITSSYWDKETTGKEESAGVGGEGKSTEDMMKRDTYSGWGFDEIWEIQEGVSYPTLINNPERH